MRKLRMIIPASFRRRTVGVAASLALRALLNLVGLAVLLPVLALVLDPAATTGDGMLAQVYAWSGIATPRMFAIVVCGCVVVLIVIKCLLVFYLSRMERKFTYDLYRTLSRRLYVTYHDRGLAFVKRSNSAVLARNVNVVCLAFTAGVLQPAAAIAAEAMLLVLLFTALALYTPTAALLAVGVFIPSVWIYYMLVRHRINRYGELENRAQREKARLVTETFRGYADIEINDAFPMMLRSFDRAMDKIVDTRRREAAIGQLPQTFTEIGLAVGMALLVALSAGEDDARLLFGVFAVAALRLMPSVRSIMSGWTTLRYNLYSLPILQEAEAHDTQDVPVNSPFRSEKLPFRHQIAVEGLQFRYEAESRELFNGLTFNIAKGERVGIRGTSGAGKTTLFNLLLGLYTPTAGRILIDGMPLAPFTRRAWQNRIGYVSQSLFIADTSFAANVALGIPEAEIDRQRVTEALDAAHLTTFIASLPRGIDTPVGECGCLLSGGQRQRIGIARALYREADVLFFDEATSALDNHTEEEINRSIARIAAENAGLTLIVIAHRETSLEYCDRIITIGES